MRTSSRIRGRLRRLSAAGHAGSWLLLGWCATAVATPPPAQPAPPPPASTQAPAAAPAPAQDEGFLEFLGSDDVGDAAWWEFLKKAPPRGSDPAPAPQDAKK
ncbi:MAG TPA: hypothetical protein VHW71_00635 [Steroidobacteraceae bacterium]|nr:hypothetical protein [Steroidobacteraceae bacterium]